MKSKIKTNILTAIALLFTISVCLFIGWNEYQMAKRKSEGPIVKKVTMYSEYYINQDSDPTQVPDDSKPLIVYIGQFKFNKGSDEPIFVQDGLKPHTFAQRVSNLMFKIDEIPANSTPLRKKIMQIVDDWEIKGNQVQAFFIDYRPKSPDFKAYNQFLYDLKRTDKELKYKNVNWHTIATINKDWIDTKKEEYLVLKDNSPVLFIEPTIKELQSDEFLTKLENIGMAFKVKFPVGFEDIEFDRNRLKQNNFYGSGAKVLDKDFVKPDDDLKLGFLPKALDEKFNKENK